MELPQWFKDLNIGTKIYVLVFIVGFFASIFAALGFFTLSGIMGDLHQITSNGGDTVQEQIVLDAYNRAVGARRLILLLWVSTTIMALLITNLIVNYLTKAIHRLILVSKEVSEYKLTRNVKGRTKDEIGNLFGVVGNMITNQRDIVSMINVDTEKVSTASQELAAAAEEMSATMEEVSSTIQNLAHGSQAQAQQVGKANDEMKKISDGLSSIAISAKSAVDTSSMADKRAQEGSKAAENALSRMEEMKEVVIDSTKAVEGLGERSKQIGDIVDVITNIAAQTNLLALNAAIEAARAGEHGRGFAVVADEVKKLAEGSGKAAEKIAELIEDIQSETDKAVIKMQEGALGVGEGTEVAKEALLALKHIAGAVGETTKEIEKISNATEEQLSATQRLAEFHSEIAGATEEAAANTQEVSAATEEQTAGTQEVSASALMLKDLAVELHDIMGRFKIEKKKKGAQESPKGKPETKPETSRLEVEANVPR
ncbi:MAG: methyl-accepting chemotaxis protein [Candidatus Hydrothermarchaeales archaeon]